MNHGLAVVSSSSAVPSEAGQADPLSQLPAVMLQCVVEFDPPASPHAVELQLAVAAAPSASLPVVERV